MGTKVTEQVKAELLALYKTAEWTYEQLASRFGIHKNTVRRTIDACVTTDEKRAVKTAKRQTMTGKQILEDAADAIVAEYLAGCGSTRTLAKKYGVGKTSMLTLIERRTTPEQRTEMRNKLLPRGEDNRHWKGGFKSARKGCAYRMQYVAGTGYVMEHRVAAAEAINRPLADTELVHHIDAKPSNNAPRNLAVIPTTKLHVQLHYYVYARFAELYPDQMLALNREFLAKHDLDKEQPYLT